MLGNTYKFAQAITIKILHSQCYKVCTSSQNIRMQYRQLIKVKLHKNISFWCRKTSNKRRKCNWLRSKCSLLKGKQPKKYINFGGKYLPYSRNFPSGDATISMRRHVYWRHYVVRRSTLVNYDYFQHSLCIKIPFSFLTL